MIWPLLRILAALAAYAALALPWVVIWTAPAEAQTLRFPAAAIVHEEVYHGCDLVSHRQLLDRTIYPGLLETLNHINRSYRGREVARRVRELLLEHPQTVYIQIRVGECGTPS